LLFLFYKDSQNNVIIFKSTYLIILTLSYQDALIFNLTFGIPETIVINSCSNSSKCSSVVVITGQCFHFKKLFIISYRHSMVTWNVLKLHPKHFQVSNNKKNTQRNFSFRTEFYLTIFTCVKNMTSIFSFISVV
jgi:hypothetical protein